MSSRHGRVFRRRFRGPATPGSPPEAAPAISRRKQSRARLATSEKAPKRRLSARVLPPARVCRLAPRKKPTTEHRKAEKVQDSVFFSPSVVSEFYLSFSVVSANRANTRDA